MARRPETFEQRHAKALEAAHADLRKRLAPDYWGLDQDQFISAVEAYADFMEYHLDGNYRWLFAIGKAWRRELRENGDQLNLADVLDRCIRESTLAVGKRWPEEKPAAVRKLRAA